MANPIATNLKNTKVAVRASMEYHNAILIGKEGTPEYQTWMDAHLLLAGDMGNAMKAAKETVKVQGPPDWTPNKNTHLQNGIVNMPPGIENTPPEVQAQFLYRLEYLIGDNDSGDLLERKRVAIEGMGG